MSRAALGGLLVGLGGCAWFGGGDPHKPAFAFAGTEDTTESIDLGHGYGLNLPLAVAGFTRDAVHLGAKGTGASATYTRPGEGGAVLATVSVHAAPGAGGSIIPFTGGGGDTATPSRSDAALDAAVAAIARSRPGARETGRDNVFLVRFGVVQRGRAATMDAPGGSGQPARVLVQSFCCVGGKWDYEYRFEAPAGADASEVENQFARAVAWSREPAGSVEQPE